LKYFYFAEYFATFFGVNAAQQQGQCANNSKVGGFADSVVKRGNVNLQWNPPLAFWMRASVCGSAGIMNNLILLIHYGEVHYDTPPARHVQCERTHLLPWVSGNVLEQYARRRRREKRSDVETFHETSAVWVTSFFPPA